MEQQRNLFKWIVGGVTKAKRYLYQPFVGDERDKTDVENVIPENAEVNQTITGDNEEAVANAPQNEEEGRKRVCEDLRSYYDTQLDELQKGLSNGDYKQIVTAWEAGYEDWHFSKIRRIVYCLKTDGTLSAFGTYREENPDVSVIEASSWSDLRSIIPLRYGGIAGIKNDGTVLAYGFPNFRHKDIDVTGWRDIIQIDNGNSEALLGLTSSGEVLYTPLSEEMDLRISDIKGGTKILSTEGKDVKLFALSQDGRVLQDHKYKPMTDWSNLADFAMTDEGEFIGLTKEGKILYGGAILGGVHLDESIISSWSNIVAISAGKEHLVALKNDGTVLASGSNKKGECDIDNWSDITKIEAQNYMTIGYRADGSIVIAGENPVAELAEAPLTYKYIR